ncbi:CBPC6 carboxypeptidase, partial [Polypterus senegalus]
MWRTADPQSPTRCRSEVNGIDKLAHSLGLMAGLSDILMIEGTPRSVSEMQRIPAKNVYYYRCPDHRKNYVMSFAFCFDREYDVYQFAYCYPYTYSRLQHYLDSLEKRKLDYVQRELLGLSVFPSEDVCLMKEETILVKVLQAT